MIAGAGGGLEVWHDELAGRGLDGGAEGERPIELALILGDEANVWRVSCDGG